MSLNLNIRHSGDPLNHKPVHIQENSASVSYNKDGIKHKEVLEVTKNDTLETVFSRAAVKAKNQIDFSFKFKDTSGKTIHVICNVSNWESKVNATAVEESKDHNELPQFHSCTTTRDNKGLLFSDKYSAVNFETYIAKHGYEDISFTQNNDGQIRVKIGGRIVFPKNNKEAIKFLIAKMQATGKINSPDAITIQEINGQARLFVFGQRFSADTEVSVDKLNKAMKSYIGNHQEINGTENEMQNVLNKKEPILHKRPVESEGEQAMKSYRRLQTVIKNNDISPYIKDKSDSESINRGIIHLKDDIKTIFKNSAIMKNIDIKSLNKLLMNAFVSKGHTDLKLTSEQTIIDFLYNILLEAEHEVGDKSKLAFARGSLSNIMQMDAEPERSIGEIINLMATTYIDNLKGIKNIVGEFSESEKKVSKLFLEPWQKMRPDEKNRYVSKIVEHLTLQEKDGQSFKISNLFVKLNSLGINTKNLDILVMSYKEANGNIKPVYLMGGKDKNDQTVFIDPMNGHEYSGDTTTIVKEYAENTGLADGGQLLYLTKDGHEMPFQINNGQTRRAQITTALNTMGIAFMALPVSREFMIAKFGETITRIFAAAPSLFFSSSALYGTGPMINKLMNGEKVSTQEFINTVIISAVAFSGGTKELAKLFAGSKEANMILKHTITVLNTAETSSALAMTGYVIPQGLTAAFLNDKTASDEAKLNFLFNVMLVVNAVKFNKRMETLTEKYGQDEALVIVAGENKKQPDVIKKILKVLDNADELIASNAFSKRYVSSLKNSGSKIANKGKNWTGISTDSKYAPPAPIKNQEYGEDDENK